MAVVGIQPSRTTVLMYAHPSMQSLASSIVKICSEPGGFDSNLVSSKSDIQPCNYTKTCKYDSTVSVCYLFVEQHDQQWLDATFFFEIGFIKNPKSFHIMFTRLL